MPANESMAPEAANADAAPESLLTALVAHYDELVDHVYRRFGRKSMAHEVVHEAWIQIQMRKTARAIHSPLGLLRRILYHLAVDHCRRSDTRQALVCCMEALPDAPSDQPSAERVLDARRELLMLAEVIQNLPPRCREVFILHKIHGLSQREVAEIQQVSLKTVEKHLRLGMRACRSCLQA